MKFLGPEHPNATSDVCLVAHADPGLDGKSLVFMKMLLSSSSTAGF